MRVPRLSLPRPRFRITWLIAAWPILIGMWSVFQYRHQAVTFGDGALLGLDLDALTRHPVLTGSYSRFAFHHPGPMYTYLLAPIWWIWPGASAAYFGSGVLNAIWVAIGIWAVGRIEGAAGRFTAAVGFTVLIAGLPPAVTTQSWNPSVSLLAASAFLVVAWSHTILPSRRTFATALFLGSFLAQVHVTLAPIVALVLLFLGVVRVGAYRQQRVRDANHFSVEGDTITVQAPAPPRSLATMFRRSIAWCAFAGFLWVPPLIDFFTNDPNNVSTMLKKTEELPHPHGLSTALPIMLGQLSRPIGFLMGAGTDPQWGARGLGPKLVTVVLLVLLGMAAWRRRDRTTLLGLGFVMVVCLGMLLSLTRVVDDPIPDYLGRFGGATVTVLLACIVGRHIARNMPFTAMPLGAATAVLLLAASLSSAGSIAQIHGAVEVHPEVTEFAAQLREGDILGLADADTNTVAAGMVYQARLNDRAVVMSTNTKVLTGVPINTTIVLFRPWDRTTRAPTVLLHSSTPVTADERVIARADGFTVTRLIREPKRPIGS